MVGTTSWGTTLAVVLAQKGLAVFLLARSREEALELEAQRENCLRLPGIRFPSSLAVSGVPEEALTGCRLAILAVPSQTLRQNARQIAPAISPDTIIVSAAKGLELGTCLRMSEVLLQEVPSAAGRLCALSGPNISREIADGMPSATVIASGSPAVADEARELVRTQRLRVYSSHDVVGVELGGTLKNIIALGAGMNDGWGFGANSKAAFMTRGLAEITRLGVAAGADPLTFLGLAGLGDLVATCTSPHSRNRRAGEELARGKSLEEVQRGLNGVAEGITTTVAARDLARRMAVEMPITEMTYRVLHEGLDPRNAVFELMAREPKYELEGLAGK